MPWSVLIDEFREQHFILFDVELLRQFLGGNAPMGDRDFVFVVAANQRQTRVMAKPPQIVDDFFSHRRNERLVVHIVNRASEHQILPNEQAKFVAQIEKVIGRVDAAAPDANHVVVRRHGGFEQSFGDCFVGSAKKIVFGNVVGALGEDFQSVDDEGEGFAPDVFFAFQANRAKADALDGQIADFGVAQ